jgi:hypothetical protein
MDPDACLRRIVEACQEGDRDEALSAIEDLRLWIRRGGFLPCREVEHLSRDLQWMLGRR